MNSTVEKSEYRRVRMLWAVLVLIVSMLWVISIGGCGKNRESDTVHLTMVFVPASEKGEESDFASLLRIVEQRTGYTIETINVTDYNAAIEAMRAGHAKMAWFGAKSYIQAAKIAEAEAFAVGIRKGKKSTAYYTYFVVHKDSPIIEFTKDELRGRTLALNHIGSTSGDLVPRYELMKIGLDTRNEEDFKLVQYTGSHDAAIMSVYYRNAEVAGVSSVNWDARVADGTIKPEDFRILHSSPSIAGAPLAYSKRLPQEVRDNVKRAVLEAHKYGEIGGYGGAMEKYIEATDADYAETRAMSEKLGLTY